ncbi:MAG: carbohydrate binding family 9 domain-containing protein [Saprospiraceae bacterium]|nr:carbohydrate binding family 9 domain-containing protein [Pyrinomonadaceae bacterium]
MTIDGRPAEEAWKTATVFKDFYQTSPGDNIAPSKPTEVMVMYDEMHLYVAFKCWDEKDKIRATVAKRDNIFGEDNVRMWLDTFDDQRRAYVLGFNPLGIQADGIYTEGQGSDFSVDIVMESKGIIEDWGWSVEVKIPFKSLRYSAGKGRMWGFNAARNIDRFNDEFDQWLPDDRNVSGFLIKHGKITGLDEIKYERTLEIVPSITVSETGRRVRTIPRSRTNNPYLPSILDPGRFVNEGLKQDIGLTLKYTVSPNITLDAAVNPDFAEIEADAPVVTANQRFPIFFQEKRPFFLEGADIFQSPLRVFDSRQIVDPDFATKLTGKVGKNSFGFLVASDKAPGNFDEEDRNDISVRPRFQEFFDKSALYAILRVKRDFGKENNIGFFATYRSFPEQRNLLAGVDGRMKLNPRLTSQFQVVGTNSRRCFFDAEFEPLLDPSEAQRNREICGTGTYNIFVDAEHPPISPQDAGLNSTRNGTYNHFGTGNGLGYYANLDYTTETHGWFAEIGGRSTNYRADSGFTRRTNTNFAFFINRFSTKSDPKAKIIRKSWAQFSGVDYDWQGRLQEWRAGTNINLTLQGNMFFFAETGAAYEKLYEEEFSLKRSPTRPNGTFFGPGTRATWQQFYSANLSHNVNKYFNYFWFAGYVNNAYDFFTSLNGFQNPGPGKQFDAEVFAELKPLDPLRLSASYRKSRLVRNDNRIRTFDSDLLSIRSTYQFSRFTFTRLRLDYDSTRKNYAGQLLVGWNPNPGTAFYVGYNDNFNYKGFSPYTGQFEPGFERNSRTFFIRASYLFRKSF